ncbi:hypothetical protein Tco_0690012 [Tanacetum coccineum]
MNEDYHSVCISHSSAEHQSLSTTFRLTGSPLAYNGSSNTITFSSTTSLPRQPQQAVLSSKDSAMKATMTREATSFKGVFSRSISFLPITSSGEGHVARQCKEPKRAKDSQYFKDKMLLMEAKEKGTTLDVEAEAFLANVECTSPYDQPLAMTTTNIFEVNMMMLIYQTDEGPNAAAAFMANLSSTSGTNGATTSQVNEVHTNANQIFDNVKHLLNLDAQEEHLASRC